MTTRERRYKQLHLDMRREQVLRLTSRGYSQRDIAKELGCSAVLVNNDLRYLHNQAANNVKEYVSKVLPEEMELGLQRLQDCIKEAFRDIDNPDISKRDKHSAIQLVKDCTALRLEIIGSGVLAAELNKQVNNVSSVAVSNRTSLKVNNNNEPKTVS